MLDRVGGEDFQRSLWRAASPHGRLRIRSRGPGKPKAILPAKLANLYEKRLGSPRRGLGVWRQAVLYLALAPKIETRAYWAYKAAMNFSEADRVSPAAQAYFLTRRLVDGRTGYGDGYAYGPRCA